MYPGYRLDLKFSESQKKHGQKYFKLRGKMNRKTMKYRIRKTIIGKGDDQSDVLKRILYSDTLIVIVLTGFSYLLLFLFDYGYLQQFGLPITYISFDMIQIILLVFLSIGVYAVILDFSFPVVYLTRRFGHIVSFGKIFSFFGYLLVFFSVYIIYWKNWIAIVSVWVILFFLSYIVQSIIRRVREIFGSRSFVPKSDLTVEENSLLGAFFLH